MTTNLRTPALLLFALAAFATAPAARADFDAVQAEIDRVNEMYRAITSYHVLLQGGGVTSDQVNSALYDVGRYVDEIDSRYATDKLFMKDKKVLDQLGVVVAKAHFQAAVMHARGVDLETSITEYERVLDLLGYDPADWNEEVERTAKPGLLPDAQEIAFQMTTPREAIEDLKIFWASGVVTRLKVQGFAATQRPGLAIEQVTGKKDDFSAAAFAVAAQRFGQRVKEGQEDFRIVLPPGRYRVASKDPLVPALEVQLVEGSAPDPVVLSPNTFSFAFSNADAKCRPAFSLNGIGVKDFTNLPFGTYHVTPVANCGDRRLPDKIIVDQNQEVTLRTEPEKLDYIREGQPIFVFITTPPGSTYTLRM